jgi:hypothetical protein
MFGTKKNSEGAANKVEYDITVTAARATKNDKIVMVDMLVNGIDIKSCMLKEVEVQNEGKVHKKGDIIYILQFPSEKASNGKYYNRVWFPISNENMDKILTQVQNLLDK